MFYDGVGLNTGDNFPNMSGHALANFDENDCPCLTPFSIKFVTPASAAAFTIRGSGVGTVFLEAILDGTPIESFTAIGTPTNSFAGFEGITFDEIRVTQTVSTVLDNIQFNLTGPVPDAVTTSMIDGPLVPDDMGGFDPIPGVAEGENIAIGIRDQNWIFAISITKAAQGGERAYVDALASLYELAPDLELYDGCLDGICDGIGEELGEGLECPVTVTPPSRGSSGQTLIAIDPATLATLDTCVTRVYVQLSKKSNIRSCPTAGFDDSSLTYTFPFNDGVQGFDVEMNEPFAGPFDPIRLTPVGCPAQ